MEKLTDFFKKKKLQAKFKTAGPGHKLSDSRPPQPQPQQQQQKHVPREQKTSSASSAAGQAALKRFEQPTRQTNKALGVLMEEERKKVLAEMKAKEEAQALKEQTQEAPVIIRKYICPTLGINEGYPLAELKEMIEEGIRAAYEDDVLLMSALLIKNCNDNNATQICVRTLELVLDNLRTDDETQLEKFKKLKKAKIQSKILDVKGGREFLNAVGFIVEDNDEWCTLLCENSEIKGKVEYCMDVLRNVEKLKLEMDRELVILNASDFKSDVDFGDEFYELTVDDVKSEQERRTLVQKQNEVLMTKAMRQKIQKKVPENCRLRVRINDSKLLEVTFSVRETIQDFAIWLAEKFSSDLGEFNIIYNQRVIADEMYSKTFEEMEFYPKICLLIKSK